MKRKIFVVTLLFAVVLGAYLFTVSGEKDLSKENESQNIKELVHDYSVGNIKNQSASITSHQLIVTDSDKSQITYDLPEDDFFISIAPYLDRTHP